MKILAIGGSPRQGNVEFMLKTLLDSAKQAGADTDLVLLRKLNIEHCDGCCTCDETGKCVISDDMQKLYSKMYGADVIVFGTPNYFDNISGILKDFIDRSNPVGVGRRLKDKKAFVVLAGGASPESAVNAIKTLKDYARIQQMKFVGSIAVKAFKSNEASANKKTISELQSWGKKLA